MKSFISKYGGIISGVVYGLLMRLVFNVSLHSYDFDFADLFSITFVWIVPIIVGIMPMLVATKDQLASFRYRLGMPILTVLLFFVFCFTSQLEDMICILIISIPFLLGAAVGGFVFGAVLEHYRKRKGIMYSILFLPLFTGAIEQQFKTPSDVFEIRTSVIIHATPENIWENIVRVKEIQDNEYSKGFFNYTGIPRPLYAELDKDAIGATRTGHFEGGLIFRECVTTWEKNKKVSFDIKVIPSSIREAVFDQHVLKGDHFKFLNASYELNPIGYHKTELILSSSYRLDTKINFYGSFWGDKLLTDFQERLLRVIKRRCED